MLGRLRWLSNVNLRGNPICELPDYQASGRNARNAGARARDRCAIVPCTLPCALAVRQARILSLCMWFPLCSVAAQSRMLALIPNLRVLDGRPVEGAASNKRGGKGGASAAGGDAPVADAAAAGKKRKDSGRERADDGGGAAAEAAGAEPQLRQKKKPAKQRDAQEQAGAAGDAGRGGKGKKAQEDLEDGEIPSSEGKKDKKKKKKQKKEEEEEQGGGEAAAAPAAAAAADANDGGQAKKKKKKGLGEGDSSFLQEARRAISQRRCIFLTHRAHYSAASGIVGSDLNCAIPSRSTIRCALGRCRR